MKKADLSKWFDSTDRDEFYEKNLELIKHDFDVQKEHKLGISVMVYLPEEDRYIYEQVTHATDQEDLFLDYIRKNKAIHSKAKEFLTD